MTGKRLTDTAVRQAKPDAKEYQLHVGDVAGLFLRVRPNGSKDWLLRYTIGERRRKISVGSYPEVTLSEARERARALHKQLAGGVDPQAQRIKEEADRRAAAAVAEAMPQTVRALFDHWERHELSRRKDGGKEARRKFEKDVFPMLGDLQLADLRRAHITRILDDVVARGARRIAGMLLSDLRQMFTFAVTREIMPADPTYGLRKTTWGGKANERERALSEAEIRQLAAALPSALTPTNQRALWIMLSTCCRIGEIASARWSNVDFVERTWFIPKDDSKNTKDHLINLSAFALAQFESLRVKAEDDARRHGRKVSEWVMPGRHHDGSVDPKSLTKQVGDRQRGPLKRMSRRSPMTDCLALPGGRWRPHDMRRTAATLMGELGIRGDVIEKCMNHIQLNRLVRTYQRQELRPEMKEAWGRLGHYLTRLLSDQTGTLAECPRTSSEVLQMVATSA